MALIKVNGKLLELLLLNALNEHKAYGYELTNRFTPIYQKSSGAIYLALRENWSVGKANCLLEGFEFTMR